MSSNKFRALGRKQHVSHEDFLRALSRIEQLVSRAELNSLLDQTIMEVQRVTSGKRVGFAWSGGKDSRVLEYVMMRAGIDRCVLAITDLEYPAFLQWVTDHMPPGLEVINTGQDLTWLAAHPEMLFPQTAEIAARWFKAVQHRAQDQFTRRHHLDLLILGRRRADGNYIDRGDGSGLYTRDGITRYSPLRDWAHEHVLAFCHYYNVPLPPCYRWPRGYRVGTGPWPARQWCRSIEQGWAEVYQIDSSIVRNAARVIPSAQAFLKKRETVHE